MNVMRDEAIEKVISATRRGYSLAEEAKYDEAISSYQVALAEADRLGIRSGFLLWNVAVAYDMKGDLEMAFSFIDRALEADPIAAPIRNSFEIIGNHILAALADANRDVADPSTPRLYDLAIRSGKVDVTAHAAMARFCAATGNRKRAIAIAEAMTMLYPLEAEAWSCRAELARAAGDSATAELCAIELASLGSALVPFAIPGVARG